MENVLSINNTVAGTDTTLSANVVTTGIAETAPYTNSANCITTPYYGGVLGGTLTVNSYVNNLTVKPAVNGYIVEYAYATYIAKNEKELNKLIVQLLNPNKGKKHGKKI